MDIAGVNLLAFYLLSIKHMLTAGLFKRIFQNIFNASFYHLIMIEGIYTCKLQVKCVFVVFTDPKSKECSQSAAALRGLWWRAVTL